LRDWSDEDRYVPLATELELLNSAGFSATDVVWRVGAFAVIAAKR
jgi:hypothetical protein